MIKQPPIEKIKVIYLFKIRGINIDKLNRILGETALTQKKNVFSYGFPNLKQAP